MASNKQPAEIVSTRTTLDNVTVYLHKDGKVSDRRCTLHGRLSTINMWKTWQDISTLTHDELCNLLRQK